MEPFKRINKRWLSLLQAFFSSAARMCSKCPITEHMNANTMNQAHAGASRLRVTRRITKEKNAGLGNPAGALS